MEKDWLNDALQQFGLRTRVRRAPFCAAGEAVGKLLPYGKAALVFDEGIAPHAAEAVRVSLKNYRPVCAAIGTKDAFTALFSFPDDIRAVVGMGPRSILAARFFCTLRGGYAVAIPMTPRADELFCPAAPVPWEGYPLREPDLVLADGDAMRGAPQVLAETSLAALCAEELELDRVFAGGRGDARGLRTAAKRAAEACAFDAHGREELLGASALFCLERRKLPRFGGLGAARLLRGREAALLAYFAQRYVCLFEKGRPRPFFVPDYTGRIRRAARYFDRPARTLFENVRVPTGEQSFLLAQIFREARQKLLGSAEMLAAYAQTVGEAFAAAGGRAERPAEEDLARAYELSAEFSPLLGAAALEREFGLLPNPTEIDAPRPA